MNISTIEIALDKQKLKRIFIALILVMVFGIFGIYHSFSIHQTSEFWASVFGGAGLFAFALAIGLLILYIPELKKNGPGLIISKEGVTELASLECVGLIPWSDIIEFKVIKEINQRMIAVMVRNQNEYLKKQKGMKQRIMLKNNHLYGSVIIIPLARLQSTVHDLKTQLDQNLASYRSRSTVRSPEI